MDYTDKAFENLKWTINESDLQFIKSSSDILQISIVGKRGIIVGIEGADHLQKDLRQLAFDYQYRHLRQLGLVHYYPSELADNQTEPEKYGGLSTFGLSAVKLCNNLGIIIDLAHLSEKSMNDVLKETSAPVVCSHTSIREAGDDDARKLPSEIALKIANQGGLIGIWPNSILFPSIMDYAIGLKKRRT
ncbi:hypothetical protein HED51_22450 [Ochrobactrum grignonense]|nr:hypothetical protein [Brucella grignonensis]